MLLPSIRALGDPDEDDAIIFGGEGNAEEGLPAAPVPAASVRWSGASP